MNTANKYNNHAYNKTLQPYANALRKRMTKAEACLWKYVLRARSLKGYQFRRQRPVLNYIADFMCKELMLIIEVDGITHLDENVIANDKVRQQQLENLGFTVLRFTDDEVLRHIEGVRMCLEDWIDDVEKKQPRVSTPFSSPASGG
ncbi:MAG: endonuclease domain-containing protein [Chitinophagales bacterium]|nr:endonuclease domain-containing protein [Chitinophagales bacterium]